MRVESDSGHFVEKEEAMQKEFHVRTTVQPGGKIEIVDQGFPVGESVDVVVRPVLVSDHHHLYFRTPEGGERVIQTRYRSMASAMRKAKLVGGQLHFNRVLRDDFAVHIEPCPDPWSDCHLWSGLG